MKVNKDLEACEWTINHVLKEIFGSGVTAKIVRAEKKKATRKKKK